MSRKSSSHNQQSSGNQDLQKTLEQGNQLLQSKKYKKVLALCKRYLAVTPDNPYILSLAGIAADLNQQPHIAVDYFRRAVAIAPNEVTHYFNLAKSLKHTNNIQESIATYQQALNLAPDNLAVLFNLANLYVGVGMPNVAIPLFQRLLQINAGHFNALRGLGVALRLDGQLEQARDCLLKSLEFAPGDINILADLGDIYFQLGKQADAFKAYKVVLNIDANHILALKALGTLLTHSDPHEALKYFTRAIRLAPNDVDIMDSLANVYFLIGDIPRALTIYRNIIKLFPEHAKSHYRIGVCLRAVGKKAEAIDSFRTAIKFNPEHVQAHLLLATAVKHKTHDDDMIKMEELLKRKTLDVNQKSFLRFGLGKAYEDLEDYDKAFNNYALANELKRSVINYNFDEDRQSIETIKRTFDAELFKRLDNCGYSSDTPIFIVGMPRSGTTLTEQILSSHPDVHGAGELTHIGQLAETFFSQQLKAHLPRNDEMRNQPTLQQLSKMLDRQSLEQLGKQYCDIISRYSENYRYIIDKMPFNFINIGMIHLMLPNAKIIHCTRNPLDTCFSCYSMSFENGNSFTYSQEELGQFYGLYYQLMQHWQQAGITNIIEIAYEDLIKDQEGQTRRLLDACGLEWNDACLHFHESDRPVMTASVNQVRDRIHSRSIQRWKHFESHLSPLIETLKNAVPADLLQKS